MTVPMPDPLIDPDCRDPFKHTSCAGGPCECPCHTGWCFCGLLWLLPGFPHEVDTSGRLHTRDGCPEQPSPP